MRMLVLADTEPEWGAIPEAVTTHQADIVVTAGDLNETWLRRAQLTEVPVPTYGVYGNHCNATIHNMSETFGRLWRKPGF